MSAGFTILDVLAFTLHQAALLSKQVAEYLGRILTSLMSLLGRAVRGTVDVTVALLRFALGFMLSGLSAAAHRALVAAHQESRG